MKEVIKRKCCGVVFAACIEPNCYTDEEWLKNKKEYLDRGDTAEIVESFKFEECKCSDNKQQKLNNRNVKEELKIETSIEPAILPMQCSILRDYVTQLRENVTKLKNQEGLDELAEKYYFGQDLICSMVLQEIDKLCPPVA